MWLPQHFLLGVRFPSVIHTHCTEQQWLSSLPKPCPIFRPNWCGGTCRLLQTKYSTGNSDPSDPSRVNNSGAFIEIPLRLFQGIMFSSPPSTLSSLCHLHQMNILIMFDCDILYLLMNSWSHVNM